MRKGPVAVVVVLAAALVGLLAYGLAQRGEDRTIARALAEGERAPAPEPDTALAVLGGRPGETRSVGDFRGKVVVLNVWASWCDPCKDELPLLERTHRRIAAEGGTVLGLNTRDISSSALELVRRYDLSFPSLRDRDAELVRAYGTPKYPETYVLDRRGRVAAKRIGPVDQAWLDETLPPLLDERPAV